MFLKKTPISNHSKGIISISTTNTKFLRSKASHPRQCRRVLSGLHPYNAAGADIPSRARHSTYITAGNNAPTATNAVAGTATRGHPLYKLNAIPHHHELRSFCSLSQPTVLSGPPMPVAAPVRHLHSSAPPPGMYTTSFAFFEALWEAGITHVFVNLGSDHPSIIEAMVKGQREKKGNFPRIITCPNEVRRP